MSINEFIDSKGLPTGEQQDGEYVISLTGDAEFAMITAKLSCDDELDVEDGSITTPDNTMFIYYNDDYEIRLTANYIKDIYQVIVRDR